MLSTAGVAQLVVDCRSDPRLQQCQAVCAPPHTPHGAMDQDVQVMSIFLAPQGLEALTCADSTDVQMVPLRAAAEQVSTLLCNESRRCSLRCHVALCSFHLSLCNNRDMLICEFDTHRRGSRLTNTARTDI